MQSTIATLCHSANHIILPKWTEMDRSSSLLRSTWYQNLCNALNFFAFYEFSENHDQSVADYFLSKLAYSAAGDLTNCKSIVNVDVNVNLYTA